MIKDSSVICDLINFKHTNIESRPLQMTELDFYDCLFKDIMMFDQLKS